jgi:hypothetical protein
MRLVMQGFLPMYCSSRIIEIQKQLSERAIELLALPEDTPCFILDIGYRIFFSALLAQ